eukprot:5160380-Amphidinium_carterae.3
MASTKNETTPSSSSCCRWIEEQYLIQMMTAMANGARIQCTQQLSQRHGAVSSRIELQNRVCRPQNVTLAQASCTKIPGIAASAIEIRWREHRILRTNCELPCPSFAVEKAVSLGPGEKSTSPPWPSSSDDTVLSTPVPSFLPLMLQKLPLHDYRLHGCNKEGMMSGWPFFQTSSLPPKALPIHHSVLGPERSGEHLM